MKIRKLPLGEIELLRPVHDAIFEERFDSAEYMRRLSGKRHLVLVAEADGGIVGFKVGYERDGLYSWLGGVLEGHRRKGIAARLADAQEEWAESHAFRRVWLKTYDHYKAMQAFALRRGFTICRTEYDEKRKKTAIVLEKKL